MRSLLCYWKLPRAVRTTDANSVRTTQIWALSVQNVADGGYRGGPERGAEEVLLFLRQKSNPDFSDRGPLSY